MFQKIKCDLEHPTTVRDRRGRKASCIDIERDMPGVIDPRCLHKADLPNDLSPTVQRIESVFPDIKRPALPLMLYAHASSCMAHKIIRQRDSLINQTQL